VKVYPRQLSRGQNNPVIALNETEVAKIFTWDTRSDLGSEAKKMQYANGINDLVVKFIRLDRDEQNNWDMLVMERIYPVDYRSYEIEKRELWMDIFIDELHTLHENGFVHRDLLRPSNIPGERFDNILLTPKGIRLIDVGISFIKSEVGDKIFDAALAKEKEELDKFKIFFLNR
jgi:tRNA A-37 threonylcarbamoyl transferase component Bud32